MLRLKSLVITRHVFKETCWTCQYSTCPILGTRAHRRHFFNLNSNKRSPWLPQLTLTYNKCEMGFRSHIKVCAIISLIFRSEWNCPVRVRSRSHYDLKYLLNFFNMSHTRNGHYIHVFHDSLYVGFRRLIFSNVSLI